MSSLDERLMGVLNGLVEPFGIAGSSRAVEFADKIKQAFADEGYVMLQTYNVPAGGWKKDGVTLEPTGPYLFERSNKLTGQEWYDRFEKELGPWKWNHKITMIELLQVARRAAGLL